MYMTRISEIRNQETHCMEEASNITGEIRTRIKG
jgi:hypothetical protein